MGVSGPDMGGPGLMPYCSGGASQRCLASEHGGVNSKEIVRSRIIPLYRPETHDRPSKEMGQELTKTQPERIN